MRWVGWASYLSLTLAVCVLFGCREGTSDARKRESSHLRSLVSIYNFAAAKLGHRPANEGEFKAFIAAHAATTIAPLHLGSVDELFVSERDGKAFIVAYGLPLASPGHDVVAYEQTGVAGKRLVGYSLGAIAEIDDQQFAALVPTTKQAGK